jgi:hypothetical protein
LGGGTSRADAIDGCLIERGDKGVGHVMVFVVGIEDYVGIGLELRGYSFPEGLKAGGVRDYVAIVATF